MFTGLHNHSALLPEPSQRLAPVIKSHKMQTVSVVFSTLHCKGYIADLRYIAGSVLLGIEILLPFWKARGIEDSQEKDYSFLGNDTFPNFYDVLVYERKFKSEYLRAIT